MNAKSSTVPIRVFESGATRNSDEGKNDYEGFLSPLVMKSYGDYMTKHRKLEDGTLRASDNWQKGIPPDQLMKSGFRHFVEWWFLHRESQSRVDEGFDCTVLVNLSPEQQEQIKDALNALLFNAMAYLHHILKQEQA